MEWTIQGNTTEQCYRARTLACKQDTLLYQSTLRLEAPLHPRLKCAGQKGTQAEEIEKTPLVTLYSCCQRHIQMINRALDVLYSVWNAVPGGSPDPVIMI